MSGIYSGFESYLIRCRGRVVWDNRQGRLAPLKTLEVVMRRFFSSACFSLTLAPRFCLAMRPLLLLVSTRELLLENVDCLGELLDHLILFLAPPLKHAYMLCALMIAGRFHSRCTG
ncbi:unnamed protein product [Microthlaspi erraticum]|uniref:Uncharacterized protein n=1 Tax=Microthlaspi erraticum TaxID=1685480 RepID=A0A6D2I2N6_9BRAS|nr:unnamed protein product [Microthlaspi erraticum]